MLGTLVTHERIAKTRGNYDSSTHERKTFVDRATAPGTKKKRAAIVQNKGKLKWLLMKFVNSLTDDKTFHQAVKVNNKRLTEEKSRKDLFKSSTPSTQLCFKNEEEQTTLAQSTAEIKEAADELLQLSEIDVKACTKALKKDSTSFQVPHQIVQHNVQSLEQQLLYGCRETTFIGGGTPVTPILNNKNNRATHKTFSAAPPAPPTASGHLSDSQVLDLTSGNNVSSE
ncbi:hypothetical protein EVAR_50728_1 [Eumeta japonica]|uniref:Uncharacterized protein n=1 Tax=Eumeta variegata TaxID=151549 RepID=A0A4C1YS69_EUMVA|nr:hypothetical protein EVAR_50728_1 [Eumeta japonica]